MKDEKIKVINRKPARLNKIKADLTFEVIEFLKKLYEGKDDPLILQSISRHDFPDIRIYCIKFSKDLEVEMGRNHVTLFKDERPEITESVDKIITFIKETNNA